MWPYLGKAGLTKIALKRFFVVMYFQRIENALKNISIAFWNVGNVFQWNRNALQIHFKIISKHCQCVVNALQIHFKIISKHCQCVVKHWQRIEWNRRPSWIIHRIAAISYYKIFKTSCETISMNSSKYARNSSTYMSVWIWPETSNTWCFPLILKRRRARVVKLKYFGYCYLPFWLQFLQCWTNYGGTEKDCWLHACVSNDIRFEQSIESQISLNLNEPFLWRCFAFIVYRFDKRYCASVYYTFTVQCMIFIT